MDYSAIRVDILFQLVDLSPVLNIEAGQDVWAN